MARSKFVLGVFFAVAIVVAAAASYWYGAYAQRRAEDSMLADTQATLAFAQYKSYERLEGLLLRQCYGAALTESQGLKNLQLHLLSENLRESGNKPELLEYIRVRDRRVLETLTAGQVPQPKPYTTTCQ